MCGYSSESVRIVLLMMSDVLEIHEFIALRALFQQMKDAVCRCVLGSPYVRMICQQYENAFLARRLFATDWSVHRNRCGLLDCQKPCGLWLPRPLRDAQGAMLWDHPAPASDPPSLVVTYMNDHRGPWLVTCSLSCCFKAWSLKQVVNAARRFKSRGFDRPSVLYATSHAASQQ